MKTISLKLILLSLIALLSACNGVGSAKFDEAAIGTGDATNNSTDTSLIFSGISSISNKTDSTLTLNWTAHADAVSYDVFTVVGMTPTYLTTVVGQASTSTNLTGLTPSLSYNFRVRMKTADLRTDTNTNDVSIAMDSSPGVPTVGSLVSPSASPDFTDTASIRVSGVKSGDTVKLYSNNTCTSPVLGSGTASGVTIDITASSLAVGAFSFYATSTNGLNTASACSGTSVSYSRVACSAGYTFISGTCVANFSGIISISNKTDSTLTLNWTAHADAVSYDVFRVVGSTPTYLTTVIGQASVSTNLTGLTPSLSYNFRVRMKKSNGEYDGAITDFSSSMNSAPNIPSAIALQSPSYSPSLSGTPTIRVSGVKNGDTVKLFIDSLCNTEVASALATGATIDLTTSSLAAGSYNFYARAVGISSNASACSTATVAYFRNQCPANYISVPHKTILGTSADFCVAKYEMKCVGTSCPTATPGANSVATSAASGTPWVSISQTNSRTACTNLNSINGVVNKYALISNPEWMTVAENIENVNSNWSSGTAGTDVLARGHTDNSPANALAAATDNDPYSGTGNNSGQAANSGLEQRRTLTLSNGEIIWDFAGNVWDWVDWNVTPAEKAFQSGAGNDLSVDRGWKEWSVINTKIGGGDQMRPETWESTFFPSLNSNNGLGRYYAGTNSAGGAVRRGGHWSLDESAGLFTLQLLSSASGTHPSIGFRCVYRP
jgi:hypothetical protein